MRSWCIIISINVVLSISIIRAAYIQKHELLSGYLFLLIPNKLTINRWDSVDRTTKVECYMIEVRNIFCPCSRVSSGRVTVESEIELLCQSPDPLGVKIFGVSPTVGRLHLLQCHHYLHQVFILTNLGFSYCDNSI